MPWLFDSPTGYKTESLTKVRLFVFVDCSAGRTPDDHLD